MKNTKIRKQVEDLLAGRESLKRSTVSRMEKAEAGAAEAAREMERAAKADDENAFIKAADKERFNNAIIAECKTKLAALEAVPEAEAAAMVREIQAAQAEIEIAATRKAADSIAAFYNTAADAEKEIDELQELINRYCNATGNAGLATSAMFGKRDKEIFNLLFTIKGNKARRQPIDGDTGLYTGVK